MRKETPSTDVGRVLIIGELRRKQTIGGRGGLLQSDLRFTRHKPSLVINLHVALRGWGKKKNMKRNKTLNHESAFGTNCTAVACTFRRREFRKKKKRSARFGCRRPCFILMCSTSCFRIMKANVRSPQV